MLDAIGDLLPAAVGVALSPFPIIAIVLVLGSVRATASGSAFATGWVVGLGCTTTLVVVLTGGADDPTTDVPVVLSWVKVAIGGSLIALAGRKWTTRPRDGDEPQTPGWMSTLDGVHPPRAFGLGIVLGGANPKNVAFTFAAATSISELGLGGSEAAVAAGAYVLLASSTVLGPLLAHVVAGARSEPALATVKDFMLANNAVIMMVILLILGASVLGDGLAGI